MYPEYTLPPEQKEAWLKDRTGAIVGKMVAQRFGWKVGDTIPMRSNIWVQKDGGNVWPMKVIGIYDAGNGDNQSVYFHHEYLDESRGGGMQQGQIGWVVMRIADPARADAIARRRSTRMFANSSTETKTATEKAFIQGFANQMGNIGALLTGDRRGRVLHDAAGHGQHDGAVDSRAPQRDRRDEDARLLERQRDRAGARRGSAGDRARRRDRPGARLRSSRRCIGSAVAQFFPVLGMPPSTFAIGAVLIVVLGVASPRRCPAPRLSQLKIVDALRKV